ncbi:MAG: multiple sugar transport system permease protein [Petroclostridium sp.]|jgi:multiple sugar transport system permease protein|uniref:carbohydrate ABC transporter permease n=1 Tax=Petroclostridium xylanilyticum TaxID=1792311 RepID=UPI000B992F72|nr:sugar ABC transporter permease [Petroclostridium xylanilyticum]MBZ4644604.1 binding-protein-dependent transport system inner rane component [Clostridia bacterium]MDK2810878.1 multiple sugar transport system permease protein [Petroclostridium sp.]
MNSFHNKHSLERGENLTGFLFVLPSFLGFIVFVLVPVIFSLGLSFTKWNFISGLKAIQFVGISNYIELFKDEWFISSFRNNLVFTFTTVPITAFLALVLAVIINKYTYGKDVIRVMVFIPYISSVVAVCIVWMVLLHPTYGPINQFLMQLGIKNPPRWLSDMNWALPAVIIITIWQQLGYYIIVYIAGLNSISNELYEAAEIDGANLFQKFWHITIPMVSPTTFFLVTMGIIGSFKVFDQISVLTQGGPGTATTVLAYYIYRTAFEFFRMGYASTVAWILFILVFIITMFQWRAQKKWVTYE